MEITDEDEQQLRTDLNSLIEELKIMTKENKKKDGTYLKELVDLIKQDRKETNTNKEKYSLMNSSNFNDKLQKMLCLWR